MRRFQIHAFETDSPEVRRHVDFRDFLRAHPEVAQEYADLKRRLAAQFPADIERYTEGKTDFIRAIERRARGEDR